MADWGWWIVWGLLLIVVPLTILGWLALKLAHRLVRALNEASSPGVAKLAAQYTQDQTRRPEASTEQLLGQVIHQQALRCAGIGLATGLAGIFALPIAVPIDLYASLRLQATLVHFIASQYGQRADTDQAVRVRSYLVMTGSRTATEWLTKLVLTLLGKSFAKTIPILGALISAVVNYAIAQMVGRAALAWYAGNLALPPAAAEHLRRIGLGSRSATGMATGSAPGIATGSAPGVTTGSQSEDGPGAARSS